MIPLSYHVPEISSQLPAVILADDLTGACDSAAAFAVCGLMARVVLDFEQLSRRPGEVTSCSLETRHLPEQTAARRLRKAARVSGSAPGLLFCKIDSAGRGPIGESILGLFDVSGCRCALVAPAFPDQGRWVKDGVLRVLEAKGESKSKTRQVALEQLFPKDSYSMLALIAGGNAIERGKQMRAAVAVHRPILLCDAETGEDLSILVDAVGKADCGPVLWCGSAGLARALAESFCSSQKTMPDVAPIYKEGKNCLVFAGTPHLTTARQLEALAADPATARCVTAVVRCGETTDEQVRDLWAQAQHLGGARGLILTGGDTASFVLHALRADSIRIHGEVATGIPW